jgi:hypothetical protein
MAEMPAAVLEALDRDGFYLFPNFLEPDCVAELTARLEQLYAAEGDRAGAEFRLEPGTRRLANLLDKDLTFSRLMDDPSILECVGHVLGPAFKLSSMNARSANPRSDSLQPLHVDQGLLPDSTGPCVFNVVWMLDDFTTENGSLRVVPGTHRSGINPAQTLNDPRAPHPDEVIVTGPAGSAVVMNAHLWHGGSANNTDWPRRAIHSFYCRRDKPQQQYQKGLLRPETVAQLNERQRWILAIDDPENDRLFTATPNMSGFLR